MKDLYKKANFPVIEDIFGEECYVKETRMDEKGQDKKVQEKLIAHLGISKFTNDFRAYQVLMLAKKLNHPIPSSLKRI